MKDGTLSDDGDVVVGQRIPSAFRRLLVEVLLRKDHVAGTGVEKYLDPGDLGATPIRERKTKMLVSVTGPRSPVVCFSSRSC